MEAVGGLVEIMDVSQILPNLFVGSCPGSPEDIDRLKRDFGVTAVLNVQTDDDRAHWGVDWDGLESHYRTAGIEVRRVPVRDFDPDDLRRNLPRCVEVLDELLQQDQTVCVHCNMGINRSPTIVIAYLHWVEGWDLEKATDHVLECRSCDPYLDAIGLAGEDRQRKE
jgi:atypical dual specificity phosphatase